MIPFAGGVVTLGKKHLDCFQLSQLLAKPWTWQQQY